MPVILLAVTSLAALGAAATTTPDGARPTGGQQYAQLTFRSRVVVRVESWRAGPPVGRLYKERKGPRCVAIGDLLGAAVLAPNSVDLMLRGGERMRARFAESCPGLDYYSGFYVVPPADGKICAGREVVRDRAGGECGIARLRKLVPDK
jgi:hypothetical protein